MMRAPNATVFTITVVIDLNMMFCTSMEYWINCHIEYTKNCQNSMSEDVKGKMLRSRKRKNNRVSFAVVEGGH